MSALSQQLQSDLSAVGTTHPLQHRLPLPKLDILAADADETEPPAPPASTVLKSGGRSNYRRSSCSAMSGSAPPTLEKRVLEQETEMTDVPVEQQGEPKRRKEHPTVPEAADSTSNMSSSSERLSRHRHGIGGCVCDTV